jgi:hypothetical protein
MFLLLDKAYAVNRNATCRPLAEAWREFASKFTTSYYGWHEWQKRLPAERAAHICPEAEKGE